MVETLSAPFYYIRNFFSHLAEFFSRAGSRMEDLFWIRPGIAGSGIGLLLLSFCGRLYRRKLKRQLKFGERKGYLQ